MREYLNPPTVAWDPRVGLRPSLCGRLTESGGEEQQASGGREQCDRLRLNVKVHYTDRPEPQHDDRHFHNALITTYVSPAGRYVSCPSRALVVKSRIHIALHLTVKCRKLDFPVFEKQKTRLQKYPCKKAGRYFDITALVWWGGLLVPGIVCPALRGVNAVNECNVVYLLDNHLKPDSDEQTMSVPTPSSNSYN